MELLARVASFVAPPFCWACGADAAPGPLCGLCRTRLRPLGPEPVVLAGVDVWAAVAYEGPARALVSGLKYRGAVSLADPLAARIAACAPVGLLGPRVALVPVPLTRARRRRRGFNQAELLARALARRTGAQVVPCLERAGGAGRQVGRGRAERLSAVSGVTADTGRVPPGPVLIVDDVVTTGATVRACAAALGVAGVEVAGAIAYARTPGR